VALLLGFAIQSAAYLALALTASSTLVVVRILQGRKQLFEPFGRMVIGVLLLQDLLVILLIPVLTRLPQGGAAVAAGVAATAALLVLTWIFLRWIAPVLVLRLSTDEESLLLIVLAILFVFIGLSVAFDLPLVAGAFFAGVSLSGFPVRGLVRGQLNSVSDFFSALFFITLGAFLTVPTPAELAHALVLALLVLLITPVLVAVVAERAGFSARPAIASGLLLSQASEFSLVVGLQGIVLQQIAPSAFTVIVLVTVITMMLTPLIATDRVTWWLMHFQPLWQPERVKHPPEGHVLLLGCGSNGMALLETIAISPYPVVVVDDDPGIIERLRESYIPCIRGDISDLEVLKSAGAGRARIIISTVRRPEDNAPVLSFARDVPVLVRGFNVEDLEWIRERGGIPISYAEAAADNFMQWFEEERGA
jgi:Kef-type K+ transport system membrane component KefB